MSDKLGPERYQEFYKFIATVDAAAIIAAFTLRRDLGIETVHLAFSFINFGISAYLCIIGMFWISRDQQTDNAYDWLAVIIFSLTTTGVVSVIAAGLFE